MQLPPLGGHARLEKYDSYCMGLGIAVAAVQYDHTDSRHRRDCFARVDEKEQYTLFKL
jgi:hypothetical protein